MTRDPAPIGRPPEWVSNVIWFRQNWRRYWLTLILGGVFLVGTAVVYDHKDVIYGRMGSMLNERAPVGSFPVRFVNVSDEEVRVNYVGEFYISAPKTPGMNESVGSGVLRVHESCGLIIQVSPKSQKNCSANLVNEEKLLPLVDDGDKFMLVIFSASPRPLRAEILLNRSTLTKGLDFLYPRPGQGG